MSAADRTPAIVDMHSHLVPGVDDGAATPDDVVAGVERMAECGVEEIVTTPHLSGSLTLAPEEFDLRMQEIDEAFAAAHAAVAGRFPEIAFSRANEVALDHPDIDLTDPRLRIGDGPWVLVEWAGFRAPPGSGRVLRRLREQGIEPVLAHPERYRPLEGSVAPMAEWKEAGAVFQVNHGSLAGGYGGQVQARALELLARGWVDLLSTDFHGHAWQPLHIEASRELFERAGEEADTAARIWTLLTSTNPGRIVGGEAPLEVPPLPRTSSLWTRVVSLFR